MEKIENIINIFEIDPKELKELQTLIHNKKGVCVRFQHDTYAFYEKNGEDMHIRQAKNHGKSSLAEKVVDTAKKLGETMGCKYITFVSTNEKIIKKSKSMGFDQLGDKLYGRKI